MTPLILSAIMLALALVAAVLGRRLGEKLGDRQRVVHGSSTNGGIRETADAQYGGGGGVSKKTSSTGGGEPDSTSEWMAKDELSEVGSTRGTSTDTSDMSSTLIGDKIEEDFQAYFEALGFVPVESTGTRVERSEDVRSLWERYHQSDDPSARERLIVHYSPLVKYVAGRLSVSQVSDTDYINLVSYGIFGLMTAIETYNPAKEASFDSYAVERIRSTILDELQPTSWVRDQVEQGR